MSDRAEMRPGDTQYNHRHAEAKAIAAMESRRESAWREYRNGKPMNTATRDLFYAGWDVAMLAAAEAIRSHNNGGK